MEFKPVFEDSEPKHRSMPRLAAEDGSIAEEVGTLPGVREDDEDEAGSSSTADTHELEGPAWHGWIFALAPLLAVVLGGAYASWARGMAALLLGGVMPAFPVRRRLPKMAFIALAGAVLAPLPAFLPQSFHGAMPWRDTLVNEWGIQLGNLITPQPWVAASTPHEPCGTHTPSTG